MKRRTFTNLFPEFGLDEHEDLAWEYFDEEVCGSYPDYPRTDDPTRKQRMFEQWFEDRLNALDDAWWRA